MLLLQAIKQRRRCRVVKAKRYKQVRVVLSMVEPLRKCMNVMDDRAQQREFRLGASVANVAYQVEHAMQHGRQRTVLHVDNAYRLHRFLSIADCYAFARRRCAAA